METTAISVVNEGSLLMFLQEAVSKVNEIRLVLSESIKSVEKLVVFVLALVGAVGSFQRSLKKGLKKGGRKTTKQSSKPSSPAVKARKKETSSKSSVTSRRVKKCTAA